NRWTFGSSTEPRRRDWRIASRRDQWIGIEFERAIRLDGHEAAKAGRGRHLGVARLTVGWDFAPATLRSKFSKQGRSERLLDARRLRVLFAARLFRNRFTARFLLLAAALNNRGFRRIAAATRSVGHNATAGTDPAGAASCGRDRRRGRPPEG